MVEVGPRDGLQNETDDRRRPRYKIALIDRLAGLRPAAIEATSFVSPKWVPQMADTAEVLAGHRSASPACRYPVLVPNLQGFEARWPRRRERDRRLRRRLGDLLTGRTSTARIDESLERFAPVIDAAAQPTASRCAATSPACSAAPIEGEVAPAAVARCRRQAARRWAATRSRWATPSASARPAKARAMVRGGGDAGAAGAAGRALPRHLRPGAGQHPGGAGAGDRGGRQLGGRPGGAPLCQPGATGNVASEELLYMLHGLGIETGVDLAGLVAAGNYISDSLGRPSGSKVARAAWGSAEATEKTIVPPGTEGHGCPEAPKAPRDVQP